MKFTPIKVALAVLLLTGLQGFADQRARPHAKEDTISRVGKSSGAWTVHAMQTPGAPQLSLKRIESDKVMVSWPSPSAGFVLLVNTNAVKVLWNAPREGIQDNGTNKFILLTPTKGVSYFRLEKKL